LRQARVHLAAAIAELPRERDDLADDHLGDAAGVAEGRVEDRHARTFAACEVDLVGADAEAPEGGFAFSRFVAKDWVSARLPPRLRQYDHWIERRGLFATAVLRAVFLMHPVLHGVFGVSRIRFSTYMLGCLLGYIPALAVVTWASGSLVDALKGVPKEYVLIGVGALAALFTARKLVMWQLKRRKKAQGVEAGS
jgi:hypothetical protein